MESVGAEHWKEWCEQRRGKIVLVLIILIVLSSGAGRWHEVENENEQENENDHSERSAISGSTLVARLAGSQQASRATPASRMVMAA